MTEHNSDDGVARVGPLRIQDLAKRFPLLFNSHLARPLKIGVGRDIAEAYKGLYPEFSVRGFLERYTKSSFYLEAMAKGGSRFDLDGKPDGIVTPGQIAWARDELRRRGEIENAQAKRKDLLKKIKWSKLSPRQYAIQHQLDQNQIQSQYDRATNEREKRHARARQVVGRYEASGLTVEKFAALLEPPIRPVDMHRMIKKVSAARERAREELRGPRSKTD